MTAVEPRSADASPDAPADDTGWGSWRPGRALSLLLAVGGAIGWLAAFVLSVEKVRVLEQPGYVPSCDLNPVIGCGSVMSSAQAELFGFPNPFIGVTVFPVVVAVGVLALAGVELPRFVWVGLSAGATLGAVFVLWLNVQSIFRIGALCPYCMVVWAVTLPIFAAVTTWTLRQARPASPAARGLHEWRALVVVLWAVVVLGLVVVRFWDYWSTLL